MTTSGEINWPWWLALALVALAVNLVYALLFRQSWAPPEDARFVDHNASVLVKRFLQWKFSWGTPVWVTDDELGSGAGRARAVDEHPLG